MADEMVERIPVSGLCLSEQVRRHRAHTDRQTRQLRMARGVVRSLRQVRMPAQSAYGRIVVARNHDDKSEATRGAEPRHGRRPPDHRAGGRRVSYGSP